MILQYNYSVQKKDSLPLRQKCRKVEVVRERTYEVHNYMTHSKNRAEQLRSLVRIATPQDSQKKTREGTSHREHLSYIKQLLPVPAILLLKCGS